MCALHFRDQHEWEMQRVEVEEPAGRELDPEEERKARKKKLEEWAEWEKEEAAKWKAALEATGWAVFAKPGYWRSRSKCVRFGWPTEFTHGNGRPFKDREKIEGMLRAGNSIRAIMGEMKAHRNTVLAIRRRLEAQGVKFHCLWCGSKAHKGGACARKLKRAASAGVKY